MLTVTAHFTDVYGNTHTDALFETAYASKSTNLVETLQSAGSVQQFNTVSCQFKYWHSTEAKNNGMQPMILASTVGVTSFDTYPATAEEVTDLEQYCINLLKTEILPAIDPNVVIVV